MIVVPSTKEALKEWAVSGIVVPSTEEALKEWAVFCVWPWRTQSMFGLGNVSNDRERA